MIATLSPATWRSLPGPEDITRVELPNGIVVLTRSNFNSASIVINGYLPCGSLYDPLDKLGLAGFTARALMRGTARYDFQTLHEVLESAGASLGFSANVHTITFGGRALAEDLPLLLSLLSSCVREPTFPPEQVERLRAQLLTSLAIRAQDPAEMAELTFDALLFPDHPYGRSEDGYSETVKTIRREDLEAFHWAHFRPQGMVLVVVGAVAAEEVITQVNAALGDWPAMPAAENRTVSPVAPPSQTVRKHVPLPDKVQTELVLGTLGPKRNHPDYLPASLGNNILGQFGMMGRIGEVVREKAGLAYYAMSSLNAWMVAGSWEVNAGVNPANLERAIELIREEIRRFVSEPVTEEELSDSQAHFIGRLPLSLESNAGVASALLNMERFQLGLDYLQRYPQQVLAITRDQILEVARRYLDPERLIIVSAGPPAEG
ncbi:pitrilysin family protein [uncultured Thermanaerothrix sp.]|uniref:M16 family metallopeptidase n=1 Tax=uncultured Thermanaerothrix sp. TaxID=1195149 RepID=UPI002620F62C|nr:pitrilysin family protein [uncultured Thermanaerothrix sp.]